VALVEGGKGWTCKNVGHREGGVELQWLQATGERLEKRWACVSRVWPIWRRARYITCWRWDWLDDDQVIGWLISSR